MGSFVAASVPASKLFVAEAGISPILDFCAPRLYDLAEVAGGPDCGSAPKK
jgi:hypothetical protein